MVTDATRVHHNIVRPTARRLKMTTMLPVACCLLGEPQIYMPSHGLPWIRRADSAGGPGTMG